MEDVFAGGREQKTAVVTEPSRNKGTLSKKEGIRVVNEISKAGKESKEKTW